MYSLQYPIGKWQKPNHLRMSDLETSKQVLKALPMNMRTKAHDLGQDGLAQRYRPGGWVKAQVINHVADSHMNAYIRMKWALTEDNPRIKAYDEVLWAALPDACDSEAVEASLTLLEGLHERWTSCIEALNENQLMRSWEHPESGQKFHVFQLISMYDWHSRHHLAHLSL